jgi:hypothetical protein
LYIRAAYKQITEATSLDNINIQQNQLLGKMALERFGVAYQLLSFAKWFYKMGSCPFTNQ